MSNNNQSTSQSSSNSSSLVAPANRIGRSRSVFAKKAGVAGIVGLAANTSATSTASNTSSNLKIPTQKGLNQSKDDLNNMSAISKDDMNASSFSFTKDVEEEKLGEMNDDELFQKLRDIIKGEQSEESLLQAKVADRIASSINQQYTTEYVQEWKHLNLFHYKKLHQLGSDTKDNMTDLSTLVYDLLAFKDIILEYYSVLPYKLLQDIVLISSKFYRKQGDLFWNLSEFMTYIFYFENGNPKQAADITDADINYDFFSMRQLMFQYHQQEKLLKKSSSQLEDLKKHAETIISKRYLQMEKEVEFLRGENKFLKENTSNVEKQTLKLYNELTDAFLRNQESAVSEIETDRSSSDESENIKNSKYNEELRDMGYKLDSELRGAFQKINSLKEVLDVSLNQSNTLKSTEAKVFQQLQSVSVQLGTLSKKFDGKIQDSVQNISKEIDKALEKKLKASKRDMVQWKVFNKDASTKSQMKEMLMKAREELLNIKDDNDAKEEDRDEPLAEKLLVVDESIRQIILQVAPNEFARVPEENQLRGNNTDTKRPIKMLQQTLNELRYEKNAEKMAKQSYLKKFTSSVALAVEQKDAGRSAPVKRISSSIFEENAPQTPTEEDSVNQCNASNNSTNEEKEEQISIPVHQPVARVDQMLKNIEKITTNIQEDNKSFQVYQKKLQEAEKKYVTKIKDLERQVLLLQEELVKKNTKPTGKPLNKVLNTVSAATKLKNASEDSNLLNTDFTPNPILSPSPTPSNLQNLFATPKSATGDESRSFTNSPQPKPSDKMFQNNSNSSSNTYNNMMNNSNNYGILKSNGSKTNLGVETPSKSVTFQLPTNNNTTNNTQIPNNSTNYNLTTNIEDVRRSTDVSKKGNPLTISVTDSKIKFPASNSQMSTPSKGTDPNDNIVTPNNQNTSIRNDSDIIIPSPLTQVVILSNTTNNYDSLNEESSPASVHTENNPMVLQISSYGYSPKYGYVTEQQLYSDSDYDSETTYTQPKHNVSQNPDAIKECLTAQSIVLPITTAPSKRRPEENIVVYSRSTSPVSRSESVSPTNKKKVKRTNSRKRDFEEEPIYVAPNEYGITTDEVHALPLITSLLLEDPQLHDKVMKKKEKSTSLPYLFSNTDEI